MAVWKGLDSCDLSGATMIIPSVAVGNVGQLACDLLISTFRMKKVASMYSPAVIPVVGYDPYDLFWDHLSSGCELYKYDAKNLAVLQLRAPLVFKYARNFLEDVVKKFKEMGIKEIIVLTSSFAHERKHMQSSPFRYLASSTCTYRDIVEGLKWEEHPREDEVKIFGGGFASLLLQISQENSVSCFVLYKYCSEGDNIPDAYDVIEHLSCILPLFKKEKQICMQLDQPVSWKLLFGRPPPRDIY